MTKERNTFLLKMTSNVTTDGQITDRPTQEYNRRLEIWNSLTPSLQELFTLIYGDKEEFLITPLIYPLENYIIAFNQNIDQDSIIRQLAFRLGAHIPQEETEPAAYFYYILRRAVSVFGLTGQTTNNVPSLEVIINMSPEEYHRYRQKNNMMYSTFGHNGSYYDEFGVEQSTDTYHERLLIFLDLAEQQ
jgi:hypothetical protein